MSDILPYERVPAELSIDESGDSLRLIIPMNAARRTELMRDLAKAGLQICLMTGLPPLLSVIACRALRHTHAPFWMYLLAILGWPLAMIVVISPVIWLAGRLADTVVLQIDGSEITLTKMYNRKPKRIPRANVFSFYYLPRNRATAGGLFIKYRFGNVLQFAVGTPQEMEPVAERLCRFVGVDYVPAPAPPEQQKRSLGVALSIAAIIVATAIWTAMRFATDGK